MVTIRWLKSWVGYAEAEERTSVEGISLQNLFLI
jgi:hypothetical protein